jgi:TRAP transporter TAXI family solute receptor
MNKKIFFNRSIKDLLVAIGPVGFLVILLLVFAYRHLDPAPPDHFTIATGDDQSDILEFAKEYRDYLKRDGVRLDIRSSAGPLENLKLLEDDKADVDAAFVQDGLGSVNDQPDIVSLGSLYYEPLWVFYRGKSVLNHLSQLEGKRIAVGRAGHGTRVIADRLLRLSGVDMEKTKLVHIDSADSAAALKKGDVDAAILMLAPENPLVRELEMDSDLRLMNILQAEAISRRDASYHHLVLPRGSLDLNSDRPREDVNLLGSTATLLVRDDLHPALAFLLLKAAAQVHGAPGIFEKRGEFPANKDDQFPLSDDALQYYKSGGPFWQRYLPYWLAAWFDRFVLLVIPVLAFVVPLIRSVPKIYEWRVRTRIYQRYGELKFVETQIGHRLTPEEHEKFESRLDEIEERVNKMRVPRKFTEYVYSLRGHIQFVRDRLAKKAPRRA